VEEPCVLHISSICVTWHIQIWDSFVCVTFSFIFGTWLIRTWDLAEKTQEPYTFSKEPYIFLKEPYTSSKHPHILRRALQIVRRDPFK